LKIIKNPLFWSGTKNQVSSRKKLIWARKSGTILWQTNFERILKEKIKVSFNIKDYKNEKTFSISMFDEKMNKFDKFNSLKKIGVKIN